jgi:hypothetical protein
MAEPNRIDEDITTADLAGRGQKPHDPDVRPQLLRNEPRARSELVPAAPSQIGEKATDRLHSNQDSALSGPSGPVTGGDAVQVRDDATGKDDRPTPLFAEPEVGDYRSRWISIQTAFVDEPRQAVEDADTLVASLMKKLAEGFAKERERLEGQWDRRDNVSTEDLRVALQRYRSFFDRLIAV